MTGPDVILHDDPPVEYDESSIENDLDYAAAAGGLTDDPDMADPDDVDLGPVGLTPGTDIDTLARVDSWLDDHPEAVCS